MISSHYMILYSTNPTLYPIILPMFLCYFLLALEFSRCCLCNNSDTPQRLRRSFIFHFHLPKGLITRGKPQSTSEEAPWGSPQRVMQITNAQEYYWNLRNSKNNPILTPGNQYSVYSEPVDEGKRLSGWRTSPLASSKITRLVFNILQHNSLIVSSKW